MLMVSNDIVSSGYYRAVIPHKEFRKKVFMMTNRMKRTVSIIIAVLLLISLAALSGCGDKKAKADPAAETQAASVPAATAAAATQAATQASAAPQVSGDGQNDHTGDAPADDGYIDEATALANVKQLAGSGAQIISYEKGYSPDGFKAWVVVVAPVTTSDGSETVTYYAGNQFCYPETMPDGGSGSDADDGYIDEATAIANVKQLTGSGAQIISYEKGYSPDGFKAWIVVVAPVTTADGSETVTYYSGNQFCYPADASAGN